MKKILFISGICILFSYTSVAQWKIKHLNKDSYFGGIVKFKNDSLGLFIGGNSTILKTTDVGETWDNIPMNITDNLNDFQFVGDSVVYAVSDNQIIKSANLGDSWNSISLLPGKKQLFSLWFFDIETGIVAGYDGIYRTPNGGNTWDTVWSITQSGYKYGDLKQIVFPSPDIGYAIGIGRTQSNNPLFDNFLLQSDDQGQSWNTIHTFPEILTSIYFINHDLGFIGTESGLIYKTLDGGDSWTETKLTTWNKIESIQFISESVGFATGGSNVFLLNDANWSNFFIAKTQNGGETWTSYDTIGIALKSVYFLNDTTGFVSGNYELIMKTNGQINQLPDDFPWHLAPGTNAEETSLPTASIKIYPNPATTTLFIRHTGSIGMSGKIHIINVSGQTIYSGKYMPGNETTLIDISDFLPGIYFLKIELPDTAQILKFVKN